jgi:hypothetical protein
VDPAPTIGDGNPQFSGRAAAVLATRVLGMKPTPETTHRSRVSSLVEEIFGPVRAEAGTAQRRLLVARSVLAYVGLVGTLVQVVVWLMIAVITADLDSPWWLWTTVPAAAGVAALTLADRWRGWFATTPATDDTLEMNR